MRRTPLFRWITVGLLTFVVAPSAFADPPQIQNIAPYGVRRGESFEVTVSGSNLAGKPQLLLPFAASVDVLPASDAGNLKLKVTADPRTPIGVYVVRVRTEDGVSNPFLFAVGQVPQVNETEPNNVFEAAQPIPPLIVVEGQCAGNDVDFFRFPGKKGQRIVVDAQCSRIGSGVDPTIRLTTASRKYVASADDPPGLLTDARLVATLPEDTDYVVELSDTRYQGGGRPVYRLVVGSIPVADEVYPLGGRLKETVGFELRGGTLGGLALAAGTVERLGDSESYRLQVPASVLGGLSPAESPLELEILNPVRVSTMPELRESGIDSDPPTRGVAPVFLNGRIDPPGDNDTFALAVTPGQALRIEVLAADLGSALDGQLQIKGPTGNVLATADDTTTPAQGRGQKPANLVSPDPTLDFTVPAGVNEITLTLKDLEGRGGVGYGYRISVEPVRPAFELQLADSQVSIPRGGHVLIPVTVVRRGYTGAITLGVANPPKGVNVREGAIPQGQATGVLSLTAAPDAEFDLTTLRVEGKGDGGLVVPGTKLVIFSQQGTLPTNTELFEGLTAAPALKSAVALDVPAEAIEIPHGTGVPIPVKLVRNPGADAALAVTAPGPLPPGLTVPAANLAEKAAEGNVTVNAAPEAPLATFTLGLIAKGKLDNKDRTLALPAVKVTVVRPADLQLTAPTVELNAGGTVEIKGKVVRKAPFKEAVTVRIDGLPASLKAEPVQVKGEESEFSIKVAADAKAAPATIKPNVVVAFQINKKDYPTPPKSVEIKVQAAK